MNEVIVMGLLGSLAAGMCTSLGAIPALLFGRPGQRVETLMLGFAAGIMLAASVFSLIIPGLQAADAVFQSENAKALLAVGGILMGVGGALAMGCSVGQGLTGLSTLSYVSMIAFAGILLGAWLALRRELSVITPPKPVHRQHRREQHQ